MCEKKGISKDFPPLTTQKVSYQDTLNLVFKFNVFLQKQPGILFTLVYNLPGQNMDAFLLCSSLLPPCNLQQRLTNYGRSKAVAEWMINQPQIVTQSIWGLHSYFNKDNQCMSVRSKTSPKKSITNANELPICLISTCYQCNPPQGKREQLNSYDLGCDEGEMASIQSVDFYLETIFLLLKVEVKTSILRSERLPVRKPLSLGFQKTTLGTGEMARG